MKSNKKIKIFVDCHVFDKGFQGTRSYFQGLYLELIKQNNIVFYLAAKDIVNLKKCFGEHENVFYVAYKSKSAVYRLLVDIPKIIKKNNIDFAHFQYRISPIKKCKNILTIHDVLFEDFPEDFPTLNRIQSFFTYKYSAKNADIVFASSKYSKRQIEKHLKVANVIEKPIGIEDIFFEEYDKENIQKEITDKFNISNYFLYVSRFEPRKNQHLLLKYFLEEKIYKTHDLVFIGNKTFDYKEFETLYSKLSEEIKSKIKIFERIEFSDLTKIIKGAKASVYASRAEGFGIPPLESIASNVTTICSNQTAMQDFVFFEEYFFNPNDELDFKRALKLVVSSKDKNIVSKTNYVRENYNWKIAAKIYLNEIMKFTDS